MIASEFNRFCQPYFYDYTSTLIAAQDATRLHAETLEFKSLFDFSKVEDLPLHDLVAKHIIDLPEDFVFISNGPQSDVFERFFIELFPYYRSDITFMHPEKEMTTAWLDENIDRYLIPHPHDAHKLKTMESLIAQGRPCGSMNPFVHIKKLIGTWVVQEHYTIVPMFLLGNRYPDMCVPSFTLPFVRAFIKDVQLPNCKLGAAADQVGPVVIMWSLLAAKGKKIPLIQHIENSDDWNWYPRIINRNWNNSAYHHLEDFV